MRTDEQPGMSGRFRPGDLAIWNNLLCRVMEIRGHEATIKRTDLSASTALVSSLTLVKEIRIGRDAVGRPVLYVDAKSGCFLSSVFQLLDPQTLRLPNDPPPALREELLAANRGNERLASELSKAHELIRSHEQTIREAEADKEELRRFVDKENSRLSIEVMKLRGELAGQNELRNKFNKLWSDEAALRAENARLVARNAEWKDLVGKLEAEVDRLRESKTTEGKTRLIIELQEQLAQAKRDKDVECAALRALVESQDKKTRELFDNHTKAVGESGDTIRHLRDQVAQANERIRSLTDQNETLRLQVTNLRGERDRALDERDREKMMGGGAQRIAETVRVLQRRLLNTESELANARHTLIALHSELLKEANS